MFARSIKRLSVARDIARSKQRTKSAVWERCERKRVIQECVVASSQFWTRMDIEGALRCSRIAMGGRALAILRQCPTIRKDLRHTQTGSWRTSKLLAAASLV